MIKDISRGEIYYLKKGSKAIGSEQSGSRPVIVIQNNVGNHFSGTTIVIPLTSKCKKKSQPTHICIEPIKETGLKVRSTALCEQILTVDKARLSDKIGQVNDNIMNEINKCLSVSIGLETN